MAAIKRALISVSDKTGVVSFARALVERGVEILSTGGTARLLRSNDVPVVEIADYTGFPEMLDGRVKTLHPRVHAGLLARRDDETHRDALREHDIAPIDLVVVNLYPFEQTAAQPNCALADAIEQIDIGGPTMLRAAAKNYSAVTVVVDAADHALVLDEMRAHENATTPQTRFRLAVKAFEHTARYDGAIANYLGALEADGTRADFAHTFNLQVRLAQTLRYGENPHQRAAFYVDHNAAPGTIAGAKQLQGRELSYNN
ncbi:MAG: bifunctional phosphoribosylaminoimidazolecarboxamide formyltransferase/IMP cyclohydrolase, partial [Sulfurifustis sp.]